MQKYKGQSLAIILVLLIVGSIIGFALYARLAREAERVVDEKATAEANELTETVIGLISTSGYENISGSGALTFLGCDEETLKQPEGCRKSGITLSELELFFISIGLEDVDFSSFSADLGDDYCMTEIAMRYGLTNDEITIEQDDTYSLFLNRVDWSDCSIDFIMTRNDTASGFVLSTFYGAHAGADNDITAYKDYEFADITGFTYSGTPRNWVPYNSGVQILNISSSSSSYPISKGGFAIHEVRFKSLRGDSNLRWEVTGNGCDVDTYLLMEVGSTCGEKYIGKNFVIPSEVFAPAIFDYVLFNGQGPLVPERINR